MSRDDDQAMKEFARDWREFLNDPTGGLGPARSPLREFAEWIVSLDDDDPDSPGRQARKTVTLSDIINRAKEALNG